MKMKNGEFEELLKNIIKTLDTVESVFIFHNKEGIISKKSNKRSIGVISKKEEAILHHLEIFKKTENIEAGTLAVGMENFRLIFSETNSDLILLFITKLEASLEGILPYLYICSEKIIRISMGKYVNSHIPQLFMENQSSDEEIKILEDKRYNNVSIVVKVVLAGDSAVGKTTLVTQFIDSKFDADLKSTIGVNLMKKTIKYDRWNNEFGMSIYDVAGQNQFKFARKAYIQNAACGMLVYDVTRPETFKNIDKWYAEIKTIVPDIMLVLIANKIDLENERRVSSEAGKNIAKRYKMRYIETSALNKDIVDEAFFTMGLTYILIQKRKQMLKKK